MTVYSDAAGNKYLGDCRWGNHDINYPTTNYLKTETEYNRGSSSSLNTYHDLVIDSALTPLGYTGISRSNSTVTPHWTATFPGGGISARSNFSAAHTGTFLDLRTADRGNNTSFVFYPASVASADMYAHTWWTIDSNATYVRAIFSCVAVLKDVNTNFGYYSGSRSTHSVALSTAFDSNLTLPIYSKFHHIENAQKTLLETGRAAYTISCSDGQTPGSQWATDMWVYDNNAALGYPVIGRVPNMLLGIGDYTYLKPVKIEGSVFPDGGSPWYLPVGQFAGKVLLMRCYSSM